MNLSCLVLYISLNSIKIEYFISLSIITIIESYDSLVIGLPDFGSLVIKSIVILSYGTVGTSVN